MHGRCTAKDPRDPTGFHTCGSYALNNHPESGLCDVCWERLRAEKVEARMAVLEEELRRVRGLLRQRLISTPSTVR